MHPTGYAINTFAPHDLVVMHATSEATRGAFAAACITKDPPARYRWKGAWVQKAASAGAGVASTAGWTAEAARCCSSRDGIGAYRASLSGYAASLIESLLAIGDT
jgi:hypothetical protein